MEREEGEEEGEAGRREKDEGEGGGRGGGRRTKEREERKKQRWPSYTVSKLHLDELLHERDDRLLFRPDTTLYHPQVGVPASQ